jgi:hypothetical protein
VDRYFVVMQDPEGNEFCLSLDSPIGFCAM